MKYTKIKRVYTYMHWCFIKMFKEKKSVTFIGMKGKLTWLHHQMMIIFLDMYLETRQQVYSVNFVGRSEYKILTKCITIEFWKIVNE